MYFLINIHNDIVYVGQSEDCYTRINVHKHNNKKLFKRYKIVPVPKTDKSLRFYEKLYINKFHPIFNIEGNPQYKGLKKTSRSRYRKNNNGGRPKGLSQRLIDLTPKVLELYKNNEIPVTAISEELGIGYGSVYNIIKKSGIKLYERKKS